MLWVLFCLLSDKKFILLDALYFSPVSQNQFAQKFIYGEIGINSNSVRISLTASY